MIMMNSAKVPTAREMHHPHVPHATIRQRTPSCASALDEAGFQPLVRDDTAYLVETNNKRYAAVKSTIISSNEGCGPWNEILFSKPASPWRSSTAS
jgi:hypothetical protein